MSAVDITASVFVLTGVALSVLAAIGLHRFGDVFARMHSATKPATLGLVMVIIGAGMRADDPETAVKLALVAIIQFITAPIGAHMVGRAAYQAGVELSDETAVDELADGVIGDGGQGLAEQRRRRHSS
ncbi:MAG: monovalent cation/H(+) antiporter subunit G [Acidimicrobiales bacterium]